MSAFLEKFRSILVIGVAFCALEPGWAAAQSTPLQQPRTWLLNLPAQPLSLSLEAVSRQTDTNILYKPEMVAGLAAPALSGTLSVQDALARLLAGTGLEAAPDANGALIIRTAGTSKGAAADLNEIVITAQHRNELLQDVPIAVTAISSRELENQRIRDLQDVSRVTPGLLVSSFSYSSPTIAIRGASNTFTQIGVNKPVSVVVDDVFITRPSAAVFELFDLDSVQVLRGPQGTLFGRNVTGGAVVLSTAKPSFNETGYAGSVTYGNYDQIGVNALASGPIDDTVAAKIAVSHDSHDGYGRDRLTGRAEDDLDSSTVRGQLRLRGDEVDSLFSADYAIDSNGGRALSSLAGGNDGDRRTSELGIDQEFKRHLGGLSNKTDIDLGDFGDVTAITAYRLSQSHEIYSMTGASYIFLTSGGQQIADDADTVKDVSEEIRYSSPRWSAGDFVAGLYYLDDDAKESLRSVTLAARTGLRTVNTLADQAVTTDSIAGFVDGNINLPAGFRLTLGERYTSDSKSASLEQINVIAPAAGFDTGTLSKTWNQLTPRAVLTWTPIDDQMIYASVTKGFTSGGYNTEGTSLAAVVKPFDPERVTNYETGLKSTLANGMVTADLSVFQMEYHDKQEFVFNTVTGIGTILNAAAATSKGAELEVGLHPVKGLDATLVYGRLDTKYDDFFIAKVINDTGNPLGSSPRNKVAATINYETRLADIGYAGLNVSYSWVDDYYTGATKNPQLFVPRYSLLNASLSYETDNRRYRLSLWGKNLFDKDYLMTPSTSGVLSEYLGPPRTFGATLSARF